MPAPSAASPRVCLIEDDAVAGLEPLALTRPAEDLLCGLTSLGYKQGRAMGAPPVGLLVRPYLADVVRQRQPRMAVNDVPWLRAGPLVLVNARWLPPDKLNRAVTRPCVGMVGEEVAYAVLGPDQVGAVPWDDGAGLLETCKRRLPSRPVGGAWCAISGNWSISMQSRSKSTLAPPSRLAAASRPGADRPC